MKKIRVAKHVGKQLVGPEVGPTDVKQRQPHLHGVNDLLNKEYRDVYDNKILDNGCESEHKSDIKPIRANACGGFTVG